MEDQRESHSIISQLDTKGFFSPSYNWEDVEPDPNVYCDFPTCTRRDTRPVMLFTLYMNDLPTVTKFSNIESYVDDTKIYLSCASKDIHSCMQQVSWKEGT